MSHINTLVVNGWSGPDKIGTVTSPDPTASPDLPTLIFGRPLRPDALAKATDILAAADRLLRTDPSATMDEIARAAGASHATIHRRFPTRTDLMVALSRWAVSRIVAALESAGIASAPAYVSLYQATRNVIEVKVSLEYARGLPPADDPTVTQLQARMQTLADDLITRCVDAGLIAADADPDWVRTVFYALVHEATSPEVPPELSVDAAATRVVETLLHGVGQFTQSTD